MQDNRKAQAIHRRIAIANHAQLQNTTTLKTVLERRTFKLIKGMSINHKIVVTRNGKIDNKDVEMKKSV